MQPASTRSVPQCLHTWEGRGLIESGETNPRYFITPKLSLQSLISQLLRNFFFLTFIITNSGYCAARHCGHRRQQRVFKPVNPTRKGFHSQLITQPTHRPRSSHEPSCESCSMELFCSSGIFIAWMTPSGQRLTWEANYSKKVVCFGTLQYKQEPLWKSSIFGGKHISQRDKLCLYYCL